MPSTPDAIVLCGGAGLRLRSIISNAPKGMADIAGRPFLELLLRQLHRHGFQRVILAVGYQKDVIRSHFGEEAFGLKLTYSEESRPLGTGGALRNAADHVETDSVLVMNGDSYTATDLAQLTSDFRESRADGSMLVVSADGRCDCGHVMVDPTHRVIGFEEKQLSSTTHYTNAGIYLLNRKLLYEIPCEIEISLERQLFLSWLREGKHLRAFISSGSCIDIGTPDRYCNAQEILAKVEVEAEDQQGAGQI